MFHLCIWSLKTKAACHHPNFWADAAIFIKDVYRRTEIDLYQSFINVAVAGLFIKYVYRLQCIQLYLLKKPE